MAKQLGFVLIAFYYLLINTSIASTFLLKVGFAIVGDPRSCVIEENVILRGLSKAIVQMRSC